MKQPTKYLTLFYLVISAAVIYGSLHAAFTTQQSINAYNQTNGESYAYTIPAQSITPKSSQPAVTGSGNTASQTVSNTTSNWAGYAAQNGTFTGVSGSWTVPAVSASGYMAADATWVGIGGVATDDLIQTGTQNVVSNDGQVSTTAFYELLPNSSNQISELSVSPGDNMSASITETVEGQWNITITDNTNGQSYSNTVNYNSSLSSAEWIEEDPSDNANQQIALDNFNNVGFTNAAAIENGNNVNLYQSGAKAVTMGDQNGQVLATASVIGTDGTSFNVTRSDASNTSTLFGYDSYPRVWVRRGYPVNPYNRYSSNSFNSVY